MYRRSGTTGFFGFSIGVATWLFTEGCSTVIDLFGWATGTDCFTFFGKFTTGMWEFMAPRSTNRNIFPIPQWVLDANPGVYTQNNWK